MKCVIFPFIRRIQWRFCFFLLSAPLKNDVQHTAVSCVFDVSACHMTDTHLDLPCWPNLSHNSLKYREICFQNTGNLSTHATSMLCWLTRGKHFEVYSEIEWPGVGKTTTKSHILCDAWYCMLPTKWYVMRSGSDFFHARFWFARVWHLKLSLALDGQVGNQEERAWKRGKERESGSGRQPDRNVHLNVSWIVGLPLFNVLPQM